MTLRASLRLTFIVALVLAHAPSFAAEPRAAEAQALFRQGTEALQRGELAEARRLLSASLAQHRHPATAFNLAVTLRGLGLPVDALEQLGALRGGGYGALPPDRQAEVEQLSRDAAAEIATIVIDVSGPPEAELQVDGHATGRTRGGEARALPVNPGVRVVVLSAPGWQPVVERVTVEAGQRLALSETMLPSMAASSSAPPAPEPRRWMRNPWLWVGVAVIAGTVAALFAVRPFTRAPESDPVFGTTQTLRRW
jgi:hypothetical protein